MKNLSAVCMALLLCLSLPGCIRESSPTGPSAAETVCSAAPAPEPEREIRYVLNTRSRKFHLPNCPSVSSMSPYNRKGTASSREEIIRSGYEPCRRCKP